MYVLELLDKWAELHKKEKEKKHSSPFSTTKEKKG